jgi:hypothetical protein
LKGCTKLEKKAEWKGIKGKRIKVKGFRKEKRNEYYTKGQK